MISAIQVIEQKREQTIKLDNKYLQEQKMKLLSKLLCWDLKLIQVSEMYLFNNQDGNIHTKFQIPQYHHEIKYCNTRTQINSETRAEIDKLSLDDAIKVICEICSSLIQKGFHFAVFYAKGQRSPHIIIYDFEELEQLNDFQRVKAQAKFWRFISPWCFHLLDQTIWDKSHFVPLEFSIHWKHGTPFNLLFEYLPQEEQHATSTC